MTRPAALLFDVFGTLVDWRGSVARMAEEAFGADVGVDWHAFADAWRAEYQPSMEEVRAGNRGFVSLDVLHRENLDRILPRFGLDHLDEAARQRATLFWHHLDPWPDVVSGFQRLRRIAPLCAQSNGNVALMLDLSRGKGLHFDMILGAEITGHYKPQPEAYLKACTLLGLEPGACMMVAAHNDDLAAARACGLRTAFVPRPREHGAGQTTDLTADEDWDLSAASMIDLADQLDAT